MKNHFSTGCRFLALAAGAFLLTSASRAATVTLTDNGATAAINLDGAAGGNPTGMYEWTVTGLGGNANQLHQQWFWYSIDGGPAHPIETISAATIQSQTQNYLAATYSNCAVSVTIAYSLTGGGFGQADIAEGITLHNGCGTNMMFHFYQYSDFNLLNSAPGDTVSMDKGFVIQYKGDTQIQETIVQPLASHFEANTTDALNNTLNKLNGGTTPLLNDNTDIGPGDATWAYQWDFAALTDATIQKDKLLDVTLVPEPSVLALLSVGATALMLRRRARA